jgi:predicted nucleic acid-binding protein
MSSLVEPVPLRPTVRRDPKDDVVLAAALGAGATRIVSYDHDLLTLGKPWGIAIVPPRQFLHDCWAR